VHLTLVQPGLGRRRADGSIDVAGEHIELREDNAMNRRRLREQLRSRYIAQVRWWGWAMLMLFVLVQVAGAPTGH